MPIQMLLRLLMGVAGFGGGSALTKKFLSPMINKAAGGLGKFPRIQSFLGAEGRGSLAGGFAGDAALQGLIGEGSMGGHDAAMDRLSTDGGQFQELLNASPSGDPSIPIQLPSENDQQFQQLMMTDPVLFQQSVGGVL